MGNRTKYYAVEKGGFVPGHEVMVFFGRDGVPGVEGKIVEVSRSGHSVTFQAEQLAAILFNLPKRVVFTWRARTRSYQQKGTPTRSGNGLAMIRRPKKERRT